jgi:hypothetical protein
MKHEDGGCVAYIGNTRSGITQACSYDTFSQCYDIKFFMDLWTTSATLGECLSLSKNDAYQTQPGNYYYQMIFAELTLLGDPELPVWLRDPSNLIVTYPSEIPLDASSFTVHVSDGTYNIDQASVCLWKNNEIYLNGETDSNGDVTFTFNPSPSTGGMMYVTVIKHWAGWPSLSNFLPYEGYTTVIGKTNPPEKPTDLTPWNTHTKDKNKSVANSGVIQYTYNSSSQVGNNVYYKFIWDDGSDSGWVGPYDAGEPASASHAWVQRGSYDVTVIVKISLTGPESDPSEPLPIKVFKLGDINGNDIFCFDDINPFVAMQAGPTKSSYYYFNPDGYYYTGDCNLDLNIGLEDINPFVYEITNHRDCQ